MVRMVPADMRRAAAAWDSAGEQVKRANPADRVGDISRAMRGGASAQQAGILVGPFGDRFATWCKEATQMGENYRGVADDHQTTDEHAGDQGNQQVSALTNLPGAWSAGNSPTAHSRSGPATLGPATAPGDQKANLIARLGEVDN